MKKEIEKGYGILSRERITFELGEINSKNVHEVFSTEPLFAQLKALKSSYDNELERQGWPSVGKSVYHFDDRDDWKYVTHPKQINEERLGKKLCVQKGHIYIQQSPDVELYSETWVLAEISWKLFMAFSNLDKSSPEKIAGDFFSIGQENQKYINNLRYGVGINAHQKHIGTAIDNQRVATQKASMNAKRRQTEFRNYTLKHWHQLKGNDTKKISEILLACHEASPSTFVTKNNKMPTLAWGKRMLKALRDEGLL